MKAHIGADSDSGLIKTSANVSDFTRAHALLHGDETTAFGDADHQETKERHKNLAAI